MIYCGVKPISIYPPSISPTLSLVDHRLCPFELVDLVDSPRAALVWFHTIAGGLIGFEKCNGLLAGGVIAVKFMESCKYLVGIRTTIINSFISFKSKNIETRGIRQFMGNHAKLQPLTLGLHSQTSLAQTQLTRPQLLKRDDSVTCQETETITIISILFQT